MNELLDKLAPRFNKRQAEILDKLDEARDALATVNMGTMFAYIEDAVQPGDSDERAAKIIASNADVLDRTLAKMLDRVDELSFAAILLSQCKPKSDEISAP